MAKTTIPVTPETRRKLKVKQNNIYNEEDREVTYDAIIQEALEALEEKRKRKKNATA